MFDWNEIKLDRDGKVILLYRHQRVLDEGIITKGDKVLDVGGWGVLATRLLEEKVDCTILDNFSEDQYFPDRVRQLPHINGDILQTNSLMGWGAGTYTVVTCFEMLEHCVDQRLAVKNMYKMLHKGGTLVGTFPIPGGAHPVGDPSVTFLTQPQLHDVLTSGGFTDINVEPTGSIVEEEKKCSYYFTATKK